MTIFDDFLKQLNVKLNKGMVGAYFIRCHDCGMVAWTFQCNYPRTDFERRGWSLKQAYLCPECWSRTAKQRTEEA